MVVSEVLNELGEVNESGKSEEPVKVHLERVAIPGLRECPGISEWNGCDLGREMNLTARYYPHLNDTGGFFVAKIIKS
jgi:16S rRNA C967 or C1407 C5-methylase (RsmB/RsmF family)